MKSCQRHLHFDCHLVSLCILLALCNIQWFRRCYIISSLHWDHNKEQQLTRNSRKTNSLSVCGGLTSPSPPVWVWLDRRAARSPGWCASPRCCSSASSWRCARRWGCHLRNSASALLRDCKLQNMTRSLAKDQLVAGKILLHGFLIFNSRGTEQECWDCLEKKTKKTKNTLDMHSDCSMKAQHNSVCCSLKKRKKKWWYQYLIVACVSVISEGTITVI